jgi:DTW domain-containing protein YfiP
MPRLTNSTPLLLIRHSKERWRTSNSARLAVQALERARMLTYGEEDVGEVIEGSWLLFPQALDHLGNPRGGAPVVHTLAGAPPPRPVRQLVVIDGTWNQARRMSHRLEAVCNLPRLALPGRPGVMRARESPSESTTSTLEAIGLALGFLDGELIGTSLLKLYDDFVAAFRAQCGKKC